jgi:polo-like kinase 4
MCGTPNYISPEVATRAAHGLETDVWGLGIMLYCFLVGRPPFDTDDGLKSTLTLVVMSEIKFPPHVSLEAQDLIKCLLQKNPKERISLKKILMHPFVLKSQGSSMQRCVSYDSGVATASYLTSQSYNSCSNGIFPPAPKAGSFQGCRPSSPMSSRRHSLTRSGCSEPTGQHGVCNSQGSFKDAYSGCSRSNGHTCPSQSHEFQNHRVLEQVPPILPANPNRFLPFNPPSNSCPGSQCDSYPNKPPSFCGEKNCSHAWNQCKQCSHIDTCGCIISQRSYCAPGPNSCNLDNLTNKVDLPFSKPKSNTFETESQPSRRHADCVPGNQILSAPKMNVPQISSKRLRPVRQKTKNVIVSILTSGEVCLEFIKIRESSEKVVEVMRISADGMRVSSNPEIYL